MRRSVSSPGEAQKTVENTTRSGVFVTNFEVFHLVVEQMILEGEIKDAKMSSFSSDF